jgi:tetratricopeptide (TPR) repeat protein
MNDEQYQIELIEKYISQNITKEETEEFEKLISEDSSFIKLYEEMKLLVTGIENSARKSLLTDLKELDAKLPEIQLKKISLSHKRTRWIGWSSALAACVVGVVITINLFTSKESNYSELYNRYYQTYSSLADANNRSGDKTPSVKDEALLSYSRGNYAEAIEKLSPLGVTNDIEVKFYLANAYMATGQITKAEENFKQVLNHESLFTDQATWYLALCYLKMNQKDKAKTTLSKLVNNSNIYMENAKEILHLIQ